MAKEQTMISLQLSKELLSNVRALAEEQETSVSSIIRKLLLDYVSTYDKR